MPKNYFMNRENRSMDSSKVRNGDFVFVVTKENQGIKHFDQLYLVKINQTLSNGERYKNGFKIAGTIIESTGFDWKEYYKNCIMNFNTPEKVDMNEVQKAYKHLINASLSDKGVVGRIQYIALPKNFKPKPETSFLKLGLSNNEICDTKTLQQQLQYIKNNYYIDCPNYEENIDKLTRFRVLKTTLDANTLHGMSIYPNYCEVTIEDNKNIVEIKYIQLDY